MPDDGCSCVVEDDVTEGDVGRREFDADVRYDTSEYGLREFALIRACGGPFLRVSGNDV
jgi:hypothetical protein